MNKNDIQASKLSEMDTEFTQLNNSAVTTGNRKLFFQIMIFTLSYLSYSTLHFVREGWSILKHDVEEKEPPGLNWVQNNNLGIVDFFFLLFYSIGLFVSGFLGDHYPIRLILPIGYSIVAVCTIMISYGGIWGITNLYYYI